MHLWEMRFPPFYFLVISNALKPRSTPTIYWPRTFQFRCRSYGNITSKLNPYLLYMFAQKSTKLFSVANFKLLSSKVKEKNDLIEIYHWNTVRAQDLTAPENRPLSNISRVRSKECRQTSKKCRHFIKRKLSINRG